MANFFKYLIHNASISHPCNAHCLYCQFLTVINLLGRGGGERGRERERGRRGRGRGCHAANKLLGNVAVSLTLTWHGGSHGSQKREEMESGSHCG